MYPEGVCKDGRQEGNRSESAAAPSSGAPASGFHFVPRFARKRPIRAILLATAVAAISYSLSHHHNDGPLAVQPAQVNAHQDQSATNRPSTDASASNDDSSNDDSWNPPIGLDRTHESLDRLTFDLSSPPQTFDPSSGFQAGPRFVPQPAGTAKKKPAGVTKPSVAQVAQAQRSPAQPAKEEPAKQEPAKEASADQPSPTIASVADESPIESPPGEPPAANAPLVQEAMVTPAEVPAAQPAVPTVPHSPKGRRSEIDQYLWSVYQRSATKRDSSGDFTWKDEAAAAHMGLVTRQYVIGGMDPDFRELLYNLGHAMDADGIHWTILSGFRDDYRQGLASGYKAHIGNSFHGGSRATGGYGHGCAADIEASNGEGSSNNAVWRWVDQHGEKFGVFRPMKQIDPAHIQPFGGWHDVAFNLRSKDALQTYLPASIDSTDAEKPPVMPLVETRSGVTEAQFDCVRSHGGHFRVAGFPHHNISSGGGSHTHRSAMFHGGRMHRFGRRRMFIVIGGLEKSTDTTELAAAQTETETAAKAEAFGKNRRDAKPHSDVKPHKVAADAGHAEKKHTEKSPGSRKEASQSAGKAQRSAKAEVKALEANAAKVQVAKAQVAKAQDAKSKDTRTKTAKAQDGKAQQAKVEQTKAQKVAAEGKHPRRHAADAKVGAAKAKNHVADRQDGTGSKKL